MLSCTSSDNAAGSVDPDPAASSITEATTTEANLEIKKKKLFSRFKELLSGQKFSRKEIAKLGLNMLLAYGFVSNISYITCVIIAWVAFGKKYGTSPLAPGQWKAYILIYSGLWAANNILRPLRFSLSLIISPGFEKMIEWVQKKTG